MLQQGLFCSNSIKVPVGKGRYRTIRETLFSKFAVMVCNQNFRRIDAFDFVQKTGLGGFHRLEDTGRNRHPG